MTWNWRRINVDAMWWRGIDADTTSFWHQMPTGPDGLTLLNLISLLFTGYSKTWKGKTDKPAQMGRQIWVLTIRTFIVFFHVSEPHPIYFNKYPLHRNTIQPPPPSTHSEHSLKEAHNVNHIVYW